MLKEIRKYFNVQLMSVAKYTEFSVSYIKALSVGERLYNLKVLHKLLPLYKALSLTKKVDELQYYKVVLNVEEEVLESELVELVKKLHTEINYKENALHKVQEKRAIYIRGLHACKSLLNDKTIFLLKEEVDWIKLRERHLLQKMQEVSLPKEIKLKAKIEGLKKEIEFINNTVT